MCDDGNIVGLHRCVNLFNFSQLIFFSKCRPQIVFGELFFHLASANHTNISENRKDRANHKFIANYFSTVPQIVCIDSGISPKILKPLS